MLAVDRDKTGQKLMAEVARLAPEGNRLFSQEPSHGKDWNEHLQEHERSRERGREQEKAKQRSQGMDR